MDQAKGLEDIGLSDIQNMVNQNNSAMAAAADKTNQFNADQAQITRDFNSSEAQKNRDWQERLSNTAHQREMADLKEAGLNPILAANNGASTPSGSSASAEAAKGVKSDVDTSNIASVANMAINARNNATALEAARINASAAIAAANAAASATRYAADQNYNASVYSTNHRPGGTGEQILHDAYETLSANGASVNAAINGATGFAVEAWNWLKNAATGKIKSK